MKWSKEVEVEVEKEVIKEVQPIIYNSNRSDPDVRALDEKLVALFNEQHPETPLEHSTVEHEGFKQAIRAYLIAEPAPDVMTWFAGNRARFFIDNGLILDISDVWGRSGLERRFPQRLPRDVLGRWQTILCPERLVLVGYLLPQIDL